ncbi:unnamed protein product, partial [Didymodactylos carnosus]
SCTTGFSGINCEFDYRVCKPTTCLNNGQCSESSNTTFSCTCADDYTSTHCELQVDTCANITCENNGVCRNSYKNWSCECLNNDYSGVYCQFKSSSLKQKEFMSKSFAAVAIGSIGTVLGFILIMDILKYVFKIDPVQATRLRTHAASLRRKEKRYEERPQKKKFKIGEPKPIAIRLRYVT